MIWRVDDDDDDADNVQGRISFGGTMLVIVGVAAASIQQRNERMFIKS